MYSCMHVCILPIMVGSLQGLWAIQSPIPGHPGSAGHGPPFEELAST